MVSVLLVDDEDLVRRGFRNALEETPDVTVVAEARTGAEAVDLFPRCEPSVVLTADLSVLEPLHGRAGVIVVASSDQDALLHRALLGGARGFLLKRVSHEELVGAVRAVARGHAFICSEMTAHLVDRFELVPPADQLSLGRLSSRELQVLACVARGRSNDDIARELYLTRATVKSHVSHILAKLRQPNRMHAALYAQRMGLVSRTG
ncbi:DNA-binding response regulator [Lentzea sp. NBRC 105346]|uniref:LuxR C-terminal-related transcriptional regulator n=1 Tax=Lentzea sp. NBRC 105346 TaxID=3032205 RepID=UPI0024A459EC|nr:response regulator transcription factor [Lentzea sp. NBRC 105346]GLZ28688.1 DNA-binding response regulator [Lentzea sp. NBRC 105346]